MAKINYSVKIIFISSVFIILECTQLGGGMGDYSDGARLEWKQERHSEECPTNWHHKWCPTRKIEYSVGTLKSARPNGTINGARPIDNSFYSESFEITGIRPDKIFTPNSDTWNDYFEIKYYNPYDALVKGKIYDIKGRLVANMKKEENGVTLRLIWDGNDINNNSVPGGLYIYQVEVSGPENKVIKGTIILVR